MPDQDPMNMIYDRLGEMTGKLDQFVMGQLEINKQNTAMFDKLFDADRKKGLAIASLQQTRRSQWKWFSIFAGSWTVVLGWVATKFFGTPPPPTLGP